MIACGIKPENKDMVLSEIKSQIHNMELGQISDEEIEMSKKGILNSLNQLADFASSLVISDFKYRTLMGSSTLIEDRKRAIRAVTKDDLIRVAKKVKLNTVFFLNQEYDCECEYDCGEDDYEE